MMAAMDPNIRKLAVLAHRGGLMLKQKFGGPAITVYARGAELTGFMWPFAKWKEHMQAFHDVTVDEVTEGEYLFLASSLGGPVTCVRVDTVDAWLLPNS